MSPNFEFQRLLAKSTRTPDQPGPHVTLEGHLTDVTEVATLISGEWGGKALASVGLAGAIWEDRLNLALPRAAFLHDLGKANSDFQRMIRAPQTVIVQALRHELVSLWLAIESDDLRGWLLARCDEIVGLTVLAAAAGHHLRLQDMSALKPRTGAGTSVRALSDHLDFHASLGAGGGLLGLEPAPKLQAMTISLLEAPFDKTKRWLREAASRELDRDERIFVALVKALVIGADVAGSAVPRTDEDLQGWVAGSLRSCCSVEGLQAVVEKGRGGNELRWFQVEMSASTAPVTFVSAGCGTGKTTGAYAWAARRATGRKLFFCYPTTGTATEGFADYVHETTGVAATLVHSRAVVDLELFDNGLDADLEPLEQRGDPEVAIKAVQSRMALARSAQILGLDSWTADVTICTVDAVLGLMQNNRRGLFTSPAIVNGAFVFDEIHQYDEALFSMLVEFIRTFGGAPIMLMTASLQKQRLRRLQEAVGQQGGELRIIPGPAELENIKRYELAAVTREVAEESARNMLGERGRVLWVCNVVDRCRTTGQELTGFDVEVLPYHSRYRYGDRVDRHGAVVRALGKGARGAAIAVTTQVCEVSLDISADLLITELAPIPALIQRLGRLNRWLLSGEQVPRICQALVIEPPDPNPYESAELDLARKWLAALSGRSVSQQDLARAHANLEDDLAQPQSFKSEWLKGGVFGEIGKVREPGYTVPVIRREDLPTRRNRSALIRGTVPMPMGPVAKEIFGWSREGVVFVAEPGRIEYDPRWGASWK